MIDDIALLGGICLGLSLWVLRLQVKLSRAEKFAKIAAYALNDIAEGNVIVTKTEDGLTIKLKGTK